MRSFVINFLFSSLCVHFFFLKNALRAVGKSSAHRDENDDDDDDYDNNGSSDQKSRRLVFSFFFFRFLRE